MKQGPVRKHVELLVKQYMPRFANSGARNVQPAEISKAS
jgi:hypothetical protein